MNINNINNSTTKQALLDISKACAVRGDIDTSAALSQIAVSLSNDIYGEADTIFNSHRYPDKTLSFAKINISKARSIPIDSLSPDEVYMLVWVVRRINTYSNFVSFKVSHLVEQGIGGTSKPWGVSKCKEVISSLKRCGALIPVDASQSKTFGTLYMISPYIIDVFGGKSNSAAGKKFYNDYIENNILDLPSCDDGNYKYPVVTAVVPGYSSRVLFTCLASPCVYVS